MIIGLSGYARTGKDEAARGLVEQHGFTRIAFADKLREFLYRLDPIVNPRYQRAFAPFETPKPVREVIDKFGWDGYKATPWGEHIRELLQRLGTECGRELIDDMIWVKAAFKDTPQKVVVADVRFPNEAQHIKDLGGYVIRIDRPGVGPANAHASETALDDWEFDAVYNNNGTISDLHYALFGYVLHFSLLQPVG